MQRPPEQRNVRIAPTAISADLNQQLTGWNLDQVERKFRVFGIEPGEESEYPDSDEQGLALTLSRDSRTHLLIYSISATPMILAAAYLLTWSRRRHLADTVTSPLELAAALLAVITLRQVLVPSDIPGFTLLDRILGMEVIAITAIAAWTHIGGPSDSAHNS